MLEGMVYLSTALAASERRSCGLSDTADECGLLTAAMLTTGLAYELQEDSVTFPLTGLVEGLFVVLGHLFGPVRHSH